jgi:hypothetical protein
MALRRIEKKKTVAAKVQTRPRAVAIAVRAAYLARTQRNVPDEAVAESPESPAIQAAPLVNLSVPTSQLTSGLAVMSLHPAPSPVLPASAELHYQFRLRHQFRLSYQLRLRFRELSHHRHNMLESVRKLLS